MSTPSGGTLHQSLLDLVSSLSRESPPLLPVTQNVPCVYLIVHNGYEDVFDLLAEIGYFDKHVQELTRLNSVAKKESLAGTGCLWSALVKGNVGLAEKIIKLSGVGDGGDGDGGADIFNCYDEKVAPSPLIICSQNGVGGSVDFILSKLQEAEDEEKRRIYLEQRMPSKDAATALFKASQNGHLEICKKLVSMGADINVKTSLDNFTPLIIACSVGSLNVVDWLLGESSLIFFDENTKPIMGPLHAACFKGHIEIIKRLTVFLDTMHEWSSWKEALVCSDNGFSCLHYACLPENSRGVLEALLGVEEVEKSFKIRNEFCKGLLLPAGKEKFNAVMLCCVKSYSSSISYLLNFAEKSGPGYVEKLVNSLDAQGRNSVFLSVERDSTPCCKILTSYKASSTIYSNSVSPLHIASYNDNPTICSLLLSSGADVHYKCIFKSKNPITARSIANQRDNKCCGILMSASKRSKGPPTRVPKWAQEYVRDIQGCKVCGKGGKRCGRCKKVFYCGKVCQGKDWKEHKIICKPC
ncbi:hypothetical protein TrVE_jg4769 [Triparma verrucosa]|uniref:MYND-type domain-containing protein n=1 Tax=Triparma verrucosa TaxID=1606542 RepID=A0A9W7F4G6_9STRA|nr:hypothetical protein TrVE_jg4769 [Triparma verrucosa]